MSESNQSENLATTKAEDPMKKIITMVGIAIAVFLVFIIFSVTSSVRNNGRLADVKELYFPVLERVDSNVVHLDKIVERMTQAVMTAEKDEIDAATELADHADATFVEIAEAYKAREADVTKLRQEFAGYVKMAKATSLAFIEGAPGDRTAEMAKMNEALKALRGDMTAFRTSSYDNFVKTLEESQSSAKVGMWLGILVGIMNLGFMGVLVFFIRNNVKMMAVIAEQNATLEHRVAERTAQLTQKTNDINAMLHNMSLGVCTVVPGNRIHPEFSSYMKTIFGTEDLADKDVMDALFAKSTLGVDFKDQVSVALGAIIGEDAMMYDFNGHLLAREMELKDGDSHKILQMDWSPIVNADDVVDKVLLIVQDVTHLRELELESAHQKEELDIISQIIKISIGKFNEFISSAHKFSAENRKLLTETSDKDADVISALFRNMHTIKGNARTYEFAFITNAAHAAEQEYDRLRKEPDAVWSSEQMLAELDAVDAAIARYVEVNEDKLGRKGRASDLLTTRGVFVANDELATLKLLVEDMSKRVAAEDVRQLQKSVGQLGLIPLQRLVSGAVDSISSLAKELEKPTPEVDIIDGEIGFNNQFAEALKSSFMHIVRNSLDHGIESPEQRRAACKPETGKVRFACVQNGDQVELHISDDGRGLALHKLHEKGIAAGRFSEGDDTTADMVAELIFASGLSTAEQVTQVSGRGVGMDAVRSFLAEHGAKVHIELSNTAAPFGFTPFRFVISIPPSCYSH